MAKAQYFVETDSYWQNSTSYFVGPFDNKTAATAWINAILTAEGNVWSSESMCGGDIKSATRVYVEPRTTTEAKRRGMTDETCLSANILPTESALNDAIIDLQEVAF